MSCLLITCSCDQEPAEVVQHVNEQEEVIKDNPKPERPSLLDVDKDVDYEAKYKPKPPADDNWITFGHFRSKKPSGWEWYLPKSLSVTCNYVLRADDSTNKTTFSVLQFDKGEGGDLESNIKRWKQLFRTNEGGPIVPRTCNVKVQNRDAKLIEFNGEYMGSSAMFHIHNQTLIVIIDQHDQGRTHFKVLGPADVVDSQRESLFNFLENIELVPAGS